MECQKCGGNPLSIEEFLASLFVTHKVTGVKGIHVKTICLDSCEEIEPTVKCGQGYDLVEMTKEICSVDDCGNLTINVFSEECENRPT